MKRGGATDRFGMMLSRHYTLVIHASMDCFETEQSCNKSIWLTQNLLLAEPGEMNDIISAILKIREHVADLM